MAAWQLSQSLPNPGSQSPTHYVIDVPPNADRLHCRQSAVLVSDKRS
jgi:hypothetical protein